VQRPALPPAILLLECCGCQIAGRYRLVPCIHFAPSLIPADVRLLQQEYKKESNLAESSEKTVLINTSSFFFFFQNSTKHTSHRLEYKHNKHPPLLILNQHSSSQTSTTSLYSFTMAVLSIRYEPDCQASSSVLSRRVAVRVVSMPCIATTPAKVRSTHADTGNTSNRDTDAGSKMSKVCCQRTGSLGHPRSNMRVLWNRLLN